MLQNASYMFPKKKNNDTKKNGGEPETFDVIGQSVIQCATQPLL